MPNWVILGGYVAGAALRGLMVGAIVLCVAMLFTKVRVPHPLVTIARCCWARRSSRWPVCHQRGLRQEVRRHRHRPDLHPHPAHPPGGVFYSVKMLPGPRPRPISTRSSTWSTRSAGSLLGVSDAATVAGLRADAGFVAVARRTRPVAAQARRGDAQRPEAGNRRTQPRWRWSPPPSPPPIHPGRGPAPRRCGLSTSARCAGGEGCGFTVRSR